MDDSIVQRGFTLTLFLISFTKIAKPNKWISLFFCWSKSGLFLTRSGNFSSCTSWFNKSHNRIFRLKEFQILDF